MRSPLSRSRTPTASRESPRFFRVRTPHGLPRLANHPAYVGSAGFLQPTLSAVDVRECICAESFRQCPILVQQRGKQSQTVEKDRMNQLSQTRANRCTRTDAICSCARHSRDSRRQLAVYHLHFHVTVENRTGAEGSVRCLEVILTCGRPGTFKPWLSEAVGSSTQRPWPAVDLTARSGGFKKRTTSWPASIETPFTATIVPYALCSCVTERTWDRDSPTRITAAGSQPSAPI